MPEAICFALAMMLRTRLEVPMRHLAQFTAELTPERLTTAKQALEQQHDEILAGRTPGPSSDEKVL
jgi:hypothetical protein